MKEKNVSVWGTRFKNKTSSLFQELGSSIEIDKRLYKEDIKGSIAHVEMLFKQKIISFKINLNRVVFPAPFLPTTPTLCPVGTNPDAFSKSGTPPIEK